MNDDKQPGCLTGLSAVCSLIGGIAALIYAIMVLFD